MSSGKKERQCFYFQLILKDKLWSPVKAREQRKQWHPTPVLLPGKSRGWRSLVGYSPWGREESDMTQQLHFHFSLSCIGQGNGNPLQCSCLENPRDGGVWWATTYGVAQSRTRLKGLSSKARDGSRFLFWFESLCNNNSSNLKGSSLDHGN